MSRRRTAPPRGRDAFEEIDRRLGGLLGSLGEAFGEVLDRSGEIDGVRERSGETVRGGVRAEWSVRVGPAAQATGRSRAAAADPAGSPPTPPHDLTETEEGWLLTADMPGADPETLSIETTDGRLEIRAAGLRTHRLSLELPDQIGRAHV